MAIVQGASGSRIITAPQIAAMSVNDQAAIVVELQAALNADPGLRAKITDTADGGLHVRWWHV